MITGQVITTEVYSEQINASYGIADPSCERALSVQVTDGSGEILEVTKTEPLIEDLSDPGSKVHTLTCTSNYKFEVKTADVYVVSLPKVTQAATEFAVAEQTVNRAESDTLTVPDLEVTWKAVTFG